MVDWGAGAKGAAGGALAGSALGPIGTAGGAIIGGAIGLLSGSGSGDQVDPMQGNYLAKDESRRANDALIYGNGPLGQQAFYDKQRQLQDQQMAASGMAGTGLQLRDQALAAAQGANQTATNQLGYQGASNATSAGLLGQSGAQWQNAGADRGLALQGLGDMRAFYNQGPGPSAAEAQLRQGQDANMAQALALARSARGPGGNASAMRQAQFSNAATGQQTNQALANIRANENVAFQNQRLNALGLYQQGAGNLQNQDIGAANSLQQAALGYGGLGVNQGQLGLGFSNLGANYNQQGNAAALDWANAGNQAGLAWSGQELGNRMNQMNFQNQLDQQTINYGYNQQALNQGAYNQTGIANAQLQQQQSAANNAFIGSLMSGAGSMLGKGGSSGQTPTASGGGGWGGTGGYWAPDNPNEFR